MRTLSSIKGPIKGPIFAKEDSDSKRQLEQLKELYLIADDKIKPQIEQDIKTLSYGILGEENINFELKNSHMPLIVLHDLRLEWKDLTAQIDYLIITKKVNIVVECKNLLGNIEVNGRGDFIRTLNYGKYYRKEGIYNPITQNKRHIDLIKQIRLETKKNIIMKSIFMKYFDCNYQSVVILANPKTIIDTKNAPKEMKNKIIRADKLIDFIKKTNKESKNEESYDKHMISLAKFFLSNHTENKTDYTEKYKQDIGQVSCENIRESVDEKEGNKSLYDELKKYRYEKSKEEDIKAYFIFNNKQMEEIISLMPKTEEDLMKVPGIGAIKCEKYGVDILEIIKKYC